MNALEIAAVALQQDGERMKAIAHNVANLNTTGFKRQVMVQASFAEAMDAAQTAQAGLSVHTDLRPGKLKATGNPLDLALGDGEYLVVQLADRTLALTRDASLKLDAAGRLVTAAGLPVQGSQGGDVTMARSVREVRIDATGGVLADDAPAGALQIVHVSEGSALKSLGGGLFALPNAGQWEAARTSAVRSGHLEASNVVASQEMVNLMNTTRHAESLVRLIQGTDEMLEKAIRKFGEL